MNRANRHAAAFSLIEILISVLILALGLLGLGALFPVVLRE
jgi:prepilin-type N-terminal cleavage/methylation domain-containing protein